MTEIHYNEVSFSYDFYAEYKSEGQSVRTAGDDIIRIFPETEEIDGIGFRTRLKISNLSHKDIFLSKAYSMCVKDLKLGGVPSPEWSIMNQGRHKNDLPSVCVAGKRDDCFADAVNRLTEEGGYVECERGKATELNGAQISVFKSDEGEVSFYFGSANAQMTEILVPVNADGTVGTVRIGGDFDCLLASGKSVFTEWVIADFGCADTALERYAEYLADVMKPRNYHKKPSVYSTWYYYGRALDENDVLVNLEYIEKKGLPFDCFQLDNGWEIDFGNWEANEKFPNDMTSVADKIKAQGMMAGIWTCPLIADQESPVAKEHPDWMLKHTDGSNCIFFAGKRENFVLDCTHPEVLKWLEELFAKLTAWGYKYHKLDFTRAFPIQRDVVYYNPYKTATSAYVDSMKAVRRGIGDDGYLSVCGGLYEPLIGIADAQRTGSDVLSHWLHPSDGNPKIPFTVKQNVLRSFMNNWWHNDPDSLMVRRNTEEGKGAHLSLGTLTDNEAVTFTANQYFGGGLICSTEPIDIIDEDRLYLLRHIMPPAETSVKPMTLFTGERFVSMVDVVVKKGWHTICAINWSDEEIDLKIRPDEAIMKKDTDYYAVSFFGGAVHKNLRSGDEVDFGRLAPHSTEIIKIAPMDVPQIIKSNAHFSMGGEVDLLLKDNVLTATGNWQYPIPACYTIALPNGKTVEMVIDNTGEYKKQFEI